MQQDPRRNPAHGFFARRAAKAAAGDADLARVGEELAKLRRFGAPDAKPTPEAPKPRIVLPPRQIGEKRRSELNLPTFRPAPPPMPALPPEPVRRYVGPAPTRTIKVRNVVQLAAALEQAHAGDLILIADGEYTMPNKRYSLNGSADRPITLMAEGGMAVLLGGNNPHSLQLDRSQHVVINGLRFAPRGPATARAINVTDGNFITIAHCWIGPGAPGKEMAPVHFGSDASGRYNNHNLVLGNVIYALGSAAIHFGPGGGQGARVVDNELRAVEVPSTHEGSFCALIAFTPGGMSCYRQIVIRGNRLVAEASVGAGIALAGVSGGDVSGNTIRLVRDAMGNCGAMLEVRGEGQVSGLLVHHNEFGYDRPGPAAARAPFGFAGPTHATFADNLGLNLGDVLGDGKFAGLVDPSRGLAPL
jgi:hypothetical protein